jgi:hypothetical protein
MAGQCPPGSRANDLWHWQIRLRTSRLETSLHSAQTFAGRLLSPGIGTLPDNQLGFTRGFKARDPDGHALLFTNH